MGKSPEAEVQTGKRGLGGRPARRPTSKGHEFAHGRAWDGRRHLNAEPPDFELVLPRKLRRGRGQGAWLVALFGLAMALSLVAGAMAMAARGGQDVAHYLDAIRAWGADAYSCAVVGGIAVLAWALFFAAAVRCIRAAKLAPPLPTRTVPAPERRRAPDEKAPLPDEPGTALADSRS